VTEALEVGVSAISRFFGMMVFIPLNGPPPLYLSDQLFSGISILPKLSARCCLAINRLGIFYWGRFSANTLKNKSANRCVDGTTTRPSAKAPSTLA
jgi:hypothetical protein